MTDYIFTSLNGEKTKMGKQDLKMIFLMHNSLQNLVRLGDQCLTFFFKKIFKGIKGF